jgi:tetratricopeptide (TPR) repeat protein
MEDVFQKGKALYGDGKYLLAVDEWAKLKPYLDDSSEVMKLMDMVRQSHTEAVEAKRSAVEAVAQDYKGLKLSYTDQMMFLLKDAGAKLKADSASYREKLKDAETSLADRKEWSVMTFNKGKVLYDQGRFEEAIDQWARLAPYLEEGSQMRVLIESMKKDYDALASSRQATEELMSKNKQAVEFGNADEMVTLLGGANQKIKARLVESQGKLEENQRTLEERKQWVEFTYQKGKKLYEDGKTKEGLEEWLVLAPYLTEYPKIRELIEQAKNDYSANKTAERVIKTMEVKKAALAPLPTKAAGASKSKEGAAVPAPKELKFVSGEVQDLDVENKSLIVKLDGKTKDNTLTVHWDDVTEVDGSEKKNISSLPKGVAVDVRYEVSSNRAIYIYAY